MTQHGGHRRSGHASRPWWAVGLHLLGALAALAAWWVLVRAAIDAGRSGRAGDGSGWVLLVVESLGAVACLLLALGLGWRMLMLAGVLSDYQPKRARGR